MTRCLRLAVPLCQAIEVVSTHGVALKDLSLVCIVCAPEGVHAVETLEPEIRIYAAALDRELNARKYIMPGLGDFGDRLYGTSGKRLGESKRPTLLRGTVETFLPNHDVYLTEWADARMVPVAEGRFDLDDYIDYIISMLHVLGGDVHVIAVCQPSVPVMAAISLMEADKDPYVPHSMVLMGGPIDTRINSNAVNRLAEDREIDWFRHHVITKVPFPHPGFLRDVYPGFLQLHGFMSMNLDRHLEAHRDLFRHLVKGDGDSAQKHREFYDEYLAVMDLAAEFYLQTVDTVFIRHALPKGKMTHRGRRIDPSQIRRVALLTVEGEHDDISAVGQTEAAHVLCTNIPAEDKAHYLQPAVGHYGVFNGSRFRAEIAPRISDFVLSHNGGRGRGSGAHPGPAKAASASR